MQRVICIYVFGSRSGKKKEEQEHALSMFYYM